MRPLLSRWLLASGIDERSFTALLRTFIVMDLRGQHFARATGTQPSSLVTPLFWVVGQCLTLSAVCSLVLFARVDLFFFTFVNLSLSVLVLATAVLVEFNEVALAPLDQDILGHRPIPPRTYAAARFANLLFYIGLIGLALNVIPLLVGNGLRDAGWWYTPAYLAAALAGNLIAATTVIAILTAAGRSGRLERLKEVLAWTQILLILVVGYGAQLLFRDDSHAFLMWGAFPPPWVGYLPTAWLARFVESAASSPSGTTLLVGMLLLASAVGACAIAVLRLGKLYQTMNLLETRHRLLPMPRHLLGGLGGLGGRWLGCFVPDREERIGFWLCRTLLARETALQMRCLLPLNMVVAVVVLGLASGQFANPLLIHDPRLVTLPILAVYLVPLAIPPIVYNLSFSRDHAGSWVLCNAPLVRPEAVAFGACKAVLAFIVVPLCLLLGLTAALSWGDPLAAALHASLAALLSWPMTLTALWLVVDTVPFSVPHARGSTLGPLAVPMAILSSACMFWAGLHFLWADTPWFWVGSALVCLTVCRPLGRQAGARLAQVWRAGS